MRAVGWSASLWAAWQSVGWSERLSASLSSVAWFAAFWSATWALYPHLRERLIQSCRWQKTDKSVRAKPLGVSTTWEQAPESTDRIGRQKLILKLEGSDAN